METNHSINKTLLDFYSFLRIGYIRALTKYSFGLFGKLSSINATGSCKIKLNIGNAYCEQTQRRYSVWDRSKIDINPDRHYMNIFFPNSLQSREEKPLYRGKKKFFYRVFFSLGEILISTRFLEGKTTAGSCFGSTVH